MVRRTFFVRAATCAVAALVTVSAAPPARAADREAAWLHPVDGSVVQPFRAPTSAYGAGHRGVDFAASPGTPVHAANAGVVTFAGDVAGSLHVVVSHSGNLRTSYSFLAGITVHQGQTVASGDIVGTTGGTGPDHDGTVLHFGLRVGDTYVDPMVLFRPPDLTKLVHLAPAGAPNDQPWTSQQERVELRVSLALPAPGTDAAGDTCVGNDGDGGCGDGVPLVGGVVSAACDVGSWLGDEAVDAVDAGLSYLRAVTGVAGAVLDRIRVPVVATIGLLRAVPGAVARALAATPLGGVVLDLVEIGRRFYDTVTADCNDNAHAADGSGGSRHRVMVVAGINSSGAAGERGPTVGLDVKALGYEPDAGEVRYFSYAADGGPYTKDDTHGDLVTEAANLRDQLRAMQREQPGREVDLLGHSQGGIVIDLFLDRFYDPTDPSLPPLGNVVTLSSPHEGAPLATAGAEIRATPGGRVVLDDLIGANTSLPPPNSPAVGELSETSSTLRTLFPHGLPDHIDYTTIGAPEDYVVPATNISVPGATESVVPVPLGPSEHSAIVSDPSSLAAVRSVLEGKPPPCVSIGTALRSAVQPVVISRVEHDFGRGAAAVLGGAH
jgi:murein DD-endopeptidase MepM/ murein hydrolase activator NlpD